MNTTAVHPSAANQHHGVDMEAHRRLQLTATLHQFQQQQQRQRAIESAFMPSNQGIGYHHFNASRPVSLNSLLAAQQANGLVGSSAARTTSSFLLDSLAMHLPRRNITPEALMEFVRASQQQQQQQSSGAAGAGGFAGPSLSRQQFQLLGIAPSLEEQQQQHQQSRYQQNLINRLTHGLPGQGEGLASSFSAYPSLVSASSGGSVPSALSLPQANPSPSTTKTQQSQDSAVSTDVDVFPLSLSTDRSTLSEYQCLIREQIDLFAAKQADIDCSAQGRNRPIVIDQVGIRCRHCSPLPSSRRSRGAVYFPAKLSGLYVLSCFCVAVCYFRISVPFSRMPHNADILFCTHFVSTRYQASQNMVLNHFSTSCQSLPPQVREEMLRLKQRKTYVLGGGKEYWARGGEIRNIIEIDNRLFFRNKIPDNMLPESSKKE